MRRLGERREIIELTIHEGRKRQVKRMCEAVGYRVRSLERVGFGPLTLGALAPGTYRRLSEAEIDALSQAGARARRGVTAPRGAKTGRRRTGGAANPIATGARTAPLSGSRDYLQRMREDSGSPDPPVALAPSTGALAGAEATVTLPRVALGEERTARHRALTVGPVAGRIAIGALILGTFAIVAAASSGPSILVPRSNEIFPNWEAGPLHLVIPRLITDPQTLGTVFSLVLVAMLVAYATAWRRCAASPCARSSSPWWC